MNGALTIRPATVADAEAIVRVYNPYVSGCTCTWQTEPDTVETRRAWLTGRSPRRPVFVAADEAGHVLGFAALSDYSPRGGFADLAEIAIYLAADAQGQGLGSRLMHTLLDAAHGAHLHALVARISGDQPGSIALHKKFGFTETGRLPAAGIKFGKRLDLVYLHRLV